jgi:hypothetical protein
LAPIYRADFARVARAVFGAQGGSVTFLGSIGAGGRGAEIGGDFVLTAGEMLQIVPKPQFDRANSLLYVRETSDLRFELLPMAHVVST